MGDAAATMASRSAAFSLLTGLVLIGALKLGSFPLLIARLPAGRHGLRRRPRPPTRPLSARITVCGTTPLDSFRRVSRPASFALLRQATIAGALYGRGTALTSARTTCSSFSLYLTARRVVRHRTCAGRRMLRNRRITERQLQGAYPAPVIQKYHGWLFRSRVIGFSLGKLQPNSKMDSELSYKFSSSTN